MVLRPLVISDGPVATDQIVTDKDCWRLVNRFAVTRLGALQFFDRAENARPQFGTGNVAAVDHGLGLAARHFKGVFAVTIEHTQCAGPDFTLRKVEALPMRRSEIRRILRGCYAPHDSTCIGVVQ